jgi:hypothetical protein
MEVGRRYRRRQTDPRRRRAVFDAARRLGVICMRVEDLSGDDATVYRAVAELETDQAWPHLQDIARRTGLSLEDTRGAVHRLMHTEPKILHEVPDTSPTDLGPVYELAPRS